MGEWSGVRIPAGPFNVFYKDRRYDRRIKKFTTVWKLYINGFRNLMKFIDQIPIKNPNHLRKIELLRKQAC